ncbi:MAG: hypothetical protein ACT4OF_14800 [Caulobacteraceae bacterium]
MKLTLTFDGELPSANGARRTAKKWELRRAFHEQLTELWDVSPVLQHAKTLAVPTHGGAFVMVDQYHGLPKRELNQSFGPTEKIKLFDPITKHGRKFVPLVRNSAALVCSVDILFLRREEPGRVIKQGGDLDNRIKTLLDGLRMPEHIEEMEHSGELPAPMNCLLEDDVLVTDIGVRTGRLLTGGNRNKNEVRLVIDVNVKATQVHTYNLAFASD